MNGFLSIIGDWHFYVLMGTYMLFSNAIGAMPMPDTNSSKGYAWFFKFANGFASNLARLMASKIPGTDAMPLPDAQKMVNQVAEAADAGTPVVVTVVPNSEQPKSK